MGGVTYQLIAYGVENVYLIGKPQITYFKCVYKRYTNFSVESIEQNLISTNTFGKSLSCIVGRNGDLVNKGILEVTLPTISLKTDTITYKSSTNKAFYKILSKAKELSTKDDIYDHFVSYQSSTIYYRITLASTLNNKQIGDTTTLTYGSGGSETFTFQKNTSYTSTVYVGSIPSGSDAPTNSDTLGGISISKVTTEGKLDTDEATNEMSHVLDTIVSYLDTQRLDNSISVEKLIKLIEVQYNNLRQKNRYYSWTPYLGYAMIDKIEILVGNKVIDSHDGIYMFILNQLRHNIDKWGSLNIMIGNTSSLNNFSTTKSSTTLYIPLEFWFNNDPSLSLPIQSLRNHEIKIKFNLKEIKEVLIEAYYDQETGLYKTRRLDSSRLAELDDFSYKFYLDNIFLDSEEKKNFSRMKYDYLITQVQISPDISYITKSFNIPFNFNHPVEYIMWFCRLDKSISYTEGSTDNIYLNYFNFSNTLLDYTRTGSGISYTSTPNKKIQFQRQDLF